MLSQQENFRSVLTKQSMQKSTAREQGNTKFHALVVSTHKKNRRDKPLSVSVDSEKIIYYCHHCGVEGLIQTKGNVIQMNQKTNGTKPKKPVKLNPMAHLIRRFSG